MNSAFAGACNSLKQAIMKKKNTAENMQAIQVSADV